MSYRPRRMFTTASLCVIAVSLGAAIEMYDDVSLGDMNLIYQGHNSFEPSLQALPGPKFDNAIRNFLLLKIMNSIRDRNVSPNEMARSKWILSNPDLESPDMLDRSFLKGTIIKRITERESIMSKSSSQSRPTVQKWKIKKGKVGSQMVCYFKLCSFRPSV